MWQKARPDDSTVIDVAAMMKAHSCGEHRYGNAPPPTPPNGMNGILQAKIIEDSLCNRPVTRYC